MGILSNIVMNISDTIEVANTPREVIFHSCPSATTAEDITYAKVVGGIILIGLLIIAIALIVCVYLNLRHKFRLQKANQAHELTKKENEIAEQKAKTEHDDAWRIIEHDWKVDYEDTWKKIDNEHKIKEKVLELKIKEVEKKDQKEKDDEKK